MRRRIGAAAIAIGAVVGVSAQQTATGIFGFAPASEAAQRETERRFLSLPSADRARDYHRYLTDEPHVAGSDAQQAPGRVDARPVEGVRARDRRDRRARGAAALPHRDEVDDGDVGGAVQRRSGARRSRHAEAAAPLQRVLEVRRGRSAGHLRGQRQSRELRLAGVAGHRRARQDRARPLLGPVQLSRLQGVDGREARARPRC